MGRRREKSTPAERDSGEYQRIEKAAREIVDAFEDQDPLLTVMALRLAAQRIYDAHCRDRAIPELDEE